MELIQGFSLGWKERYIREKGRKLKKEVKKIRGEAQRSRIRTGKWEVCKVKARAAVENKELICGLRGQTKSKFVLRKVGV